ncbi:hypothetical protein [Flavivirga eckloniae]|uniref:hypothetical protein n=1 Tax=Flavivirga eckloniae TaxID=1803846 RepID=UPI001315AD13|nr:hypothetical protein [Flavivirga eckloniae]
MNFLKGKNSKKDDVINKYVDMFTTGLAAIFTAGIFYGAYIIYNWLMDDFF